MKSILAALIIVASAKLFAADEPASLGPIKRPRFIVEEEKTSRWLVSGDFLYWVPEMEGLTFAYRQVPHYVVKMRQSDTDPNTMVASVEPSVRHKAKTLHGQWEPGVRLSTGYLFDEKGWDVRGNWSFYRSEPSMKVAKKGDNRNVVPIFNSRNSHFTSNTVTSATAKWSLFQNVAEIEVGKNFPVGDIFLARPFIGAKGLSIKNKTSFSYLLETPGISGESEVVGKSAFIGAGPEIGSNFAYEFGKGLGMFFSGSGSVMYGKFKASFDGIHKKLHAPRTVTAMQVQIGGQWKRTFAKKYHVGFLAAWEQNFYSNVNQVLNHTNIEDNQKGAQQQGDLILKGLTASWQLDF